MVTALSSKSLLLVDFHTDSLKSRTFLSFFLDCRQIVAVSCPGRRRLQTIVLGNWTEGKKCAAAYSCCGFCVRWNLDEF